MQQAASKQRVAKQQPDNNKANVVADAPPIASSSALPVIEFRDDPNQPADKVHELSIFGAQIHTLNQVGRHTLSSCLQQPRQCGPALDLLFRFFLQTQPPPGA